MAEAMKILLLCSKFPYPTRDGGTVAMFNMIRAFAREGHDVTVLAMNTAKHYTNLRDLPAEVLRMAHFHAADVDTRIRPVDALANLIFSRQSYHVLRFTSGGFREELERVLKGDGKPFDLVQLETVYMTPYVDTIRELSPDTLIALRSHNVEHEIWERRAATATRPWLKYYFEITAERIRKYESWHIRNTTYDAIVPITDRDSAQYEEIWKTYNKTDPMPIPLHVANAGIDLETVQALDGPVEIPSPFYLGALDWHPNAYGLDWFLTHVWPKVHSRYPNVRFYVAGRGMPQEMQSRSQPNVTMLGEVKDAYAFMRSKSIMVVPIFTGSGMRVKIIEGMALGKAIVATTMAAEGLKVRHGNHLMIADSPGDFLDCISVLIENRGMIEIIGRHASKYSRIVFDNHAIIEKLLVFYQKLIDARRKAREATAS
jgi:polysaccharide biosynthesis protein PslH